MNFATLLVGALVTSSNDNLSRMGRRSKHGLSQVEAEKKAFDESQQRLVGKVHTRTLEQYMGYNR